MTTDLQDTIADFLSTGPYAVVGASTRREKYGNKVFRAYRDKGREAYPVNPNASEVEGVKAYPDLASIPVRVRAISVITPPALTEKVIREAIDVGVEFVWMQPGAESPEAVRLAEAAGLKVIADGGCFLVVSGYHE